MKRSLALFLSLCLCLSLALSLASCKSKNTLLTYEKDGTKLTFSANLYELLASRAKGSLAASGVTAGGYDATKDSFWDYTDKFDGKTKETLGEYEAKQILESCKFYLAAHALFSERGLKLPDSVIEELEDTLEELIKTDAGGSKTKFNSLLSAYGVNREQLLELYRMEEEIDALKENLFGKDASLVGKTLKEEYLVSQYLHFYLIRIDPFEYCYETDANGDEIYYDSANNKIAYDKTAVKVVEDDGSVTYHLADENGEATERYAYDKEKGVRALALDESGKSYKTAPLTGDALNAFLSRIAELAEIKQKADFDPVYAEESALLQENEQKSGYASEVYLPIGNSYSSILDEIVAKLLTMENGEVALLDDEYGNYYLFCKEAPVPGAYEDEDLSAWFSDFAQGLVDSLTKEACEALFPYITVNEEVFKTLPSMKKIEPNYYY